MNEEQLSKKCANLVGQKFNRLTVLELDHIEHKYIPSKHGYSQKPYWKCQCDCGNIITLRKDSFIYPYSKVKSCGCWHREESKHRPRDKETGKYILIQR